MIKRAHKLRATDIHIDPKGDIENHVRLRIDGKLQDYCTLDKSVAEHLMNQFKLLARLDVTDPFNPMEGRVQLPASLKDVEVRFSSVPVPEGQAVALRILDPQKIFRPLGELGFCNDHFTQVEKAIRSGEGLLLVTGPTNSGKTTTIYSMLQTIGGDDKNIVSIEDPVEFTAPFVRQISVDKKHDLTMASGLRTLLRMDPDALFVGEIRDPEAAAEAAAIAMRAAASGKYVFSTLHTRNIVSTVSALVDLGLERSSTAVNLVGIVNQRLVRRLCKHCREPVAVDEIANKVFVENGMNVPESLFTATGCSACNSRGIFGRIGVFEVAVVDGPFREAILNFQSKEKLAKFLSNAGIRTLRQDALAKASDGKIGFAEANEINRLT